MDNQKASKEDNVIFIGKKPFMNYVNAVQVQLGKGTKIVIKARGKFTSRAIDVSEHCKRKFTLKAIEVLLDSESKQDKEKKDIKVSTIEITLEK